MTPEGLLRAKETIVYRFGDDSGRHGIERDFITREPYNDTQDQVFTISNITVEQPRPGVSTQFSQRDRRSQGRPEEQPRLRIGDPDETISAPTATYVISYDVPARCALHGYDEFYWDATGFDWDATLKQVAQRPGAGRGPRVDCSSGRLRASSRAPTGHRDCPVQPANLPPGDGVTIGVKIAPGLVTDNEPILEPDGSKLTRPSGPA